MTPLAITVAYSITGLALTAGLVTRWARARALTRQRYVDSYQTARRRLMCDLATAYANKRKTLHIRAALDDLDRAYEAGEPIPVPEVAS